jgi:hypothetical protein
VVNDINMQQPQEQLHHWMVRDDDYFIEKKDVHYNITYQKLVKSTLIT